MKRLIFLFALGFISLHATAQNIVQMMSGIPQWPVSGQLLFDKCKLEVVQLEDHKYIKSFELPGEYKLSEQNREAFANNASNQANSSLYTNVDHTDMTKMSQKQVEAYDRLMPASNAITQKWGETITRMMEIKQKYVLSEVSSNCADQKRQLKNQEDYASEINTFLGPKRAELQQMITAFKGDYDVVMASPSTTAKMQAAILYNMVAVVPSELHAFVQDHATGLASLKVIIQNFIYETGECN